MIIRAMRVICFLVLCFSASAFAAVTEIMLLVNGVPISNFDIQQQARMLVVTSNIEPTKKNLADAQKRAKAQLVDNILRGNIAKQNNISASKKEIRQAIKRGLRGGQSVDDFLVFLRKNKVRTENFYRHMEAEILWNKYVERHIVPRIIVPQNQVEQKLQEIKQNLQQKSYLMSQIVLHFENSTEENVARKTMAQLKQQLSKGAAFNFIARNYSQGRLASSGGNLGWVNDGNLPKKLKALVQTMTTGSISPVVRLADGFYIILLRDVRTPQTNVLKKIQLELKIIRVPRRISDAQVQQSFSDCTKTSDSAARLNADVQAMGLVPFTDLSKTLQKKLEQVKENTLVPSVRDSNRKEFILVCDKIIEEDPRLSQQRIQNSLLSQKAFIRARQKMRDLRRDASIEIK